MPNSPTGEGLVLNTHLTLFIPQEKREPQVYGALWGHKAPLDPKGRKVMLVHVEPLEVWV